MKSFYQFALAIAVCIGLMGCANHSNRENLSLVAGGVAGGAAGHVLTGGSTLGVVGGAVGGAYLGKELAKE